MQNLTSRLSTFVSTIRDRLSSTRTDNRIQNVPADDPRHGCLHIDSLSSREFEVIDIKREDQRLWLRPVGSQKHIGGVVKHISPDSSIGETLSTVSEGQYITIDMKRYTKGSEYMPFWCIEAIENVRDAQDHEQNALRK